MRERSLKDPRQGIISSAVVVAAAARFPELPIEGAEDLQLPRRDPKPLRTMKHSLLYDIITDKEESYST